MTTFFLRTCDRAGQILDDHRVEAGDIYGALAHANQHFQTMTIAPGRSMFDPMGRIDVADRHGHTVARLVCSEAMAARS